MTQGHGIIRMAYKNGHVAWGLIGMVLTEKGWRFVQNGRIITDYTGIAENQYGWWHFQNGKIDGIYTGVKTSI